MKTYGKLPNDPGIKGMNIFQWFWSYYNILEDEKEDQETLKIHLDRLAFITNPEVAKSVFEHEEKMSRKSNERKIDSRPIGSTEFNADEAIHQSKDEFDLEFIAATKGYDPESGLTPQEFLNQLKNENKADILNDSFDDLIASGEFYEIPDTSRGAGDPSETFDDFFDRVLQFKDLADEELDEIPNDLENKNNDSNLKKQSNKIDQQALNNELSEALEKYGLTMDDIDIFEVIDDEE